MKKVKLFVLVGGHIIRSLMLPVHHELISRTVNHEFRSENCPFTPLICQREHGHYVPDLHNYFMARRS